MPRETASELGGLPVPRRYVAIAATFFGTAAVVVDATAPIVALPQIGRELNIDQAETTLIVGVYQMVLLMTLLPFAALSERVGSRKIYCLGQFVFALASILCLFVTSLPMLLVLRALQGLGASAVLSSAGAMLRSIYPPGQLGRGMGLQGTVVSLSMAAAPSIGGFVLSVASWPWVFACASPLSVAMLLMYRALPKVEAHPGAFDWLGATICAAMMALLMVSLQIVAHSGEQALAVAFGIAGIVLAGWFIRSEKKQDRPIFPVDIFAIPAVSISSLAALCLFTSSMLLLVTLPFRLEASFDMNAAAIGVVLMFYPATTMVLAPIMGVLADKYRPEILGTGGLALSTVSMALLGFLPITTLGPQGVAALMMMVGAGVGCFMTPNAKIIVSSIPLHRTASGSSVISLTRLTGHSLGAAIAAIAISLGDGASGAPAVTGAVLVGIAAIVSLFRLRARK